VDSDGIRLLTELGFNRLSLGVQDFDPQVQRAVNRIQSIEQVTTLVDAARESGFKSISFDPIGETWGVNFGRGIVRKEESIPEPSSPL
jgi:oxygen-independent coproporphyrinogen-3 oxidase